MNFFRARFVTSQCDCPPPLLLYNGEPLSLIVASPCTRLTYLIEISSSFRKGDPVGRARGAKWCCNRLQGLISVIIVVGALLIMTINAGVLHDNAEQAVVPVGLPVRWQQQAHHHQRPHPPHHLHHQVSHHCHFTTVGVVSVFSSIT